MIVLYVPRFIFVFSNKPDNNFKVTEIKLEKKVEVYFVAESSSTFH